MNHTAEIKAIKETSEGTYLKVFVPSSFLQTQIQRNKQGSKAYATIKLDDNRTIRAEQRKMYYSTLKDIADYTGHLTEQLHDYFKMLYSFMYEDVRVSMSDCTVTQARNLINIVIEFAITRDIPLSDIGINRTDDIDRYLYLCLINRICSCCGANQAVDIHHCSGSRVGMGRDRSKIDHVGLEVIALCREHHSIIHQMGERGFKSKYKVYGLKLDEYAVKKLKL